MDDILARMWPWKRFSHRLDELAARHGLRRVGNARRERFTLTGEMDGHAVELVQDSVWIGRNPGPIPMLRLTVQYSIATFWLFLQQADGTWRLTVGEEPRTVAPDEVAHGPSVIAGLDALSARLRALGLTAEVGLTVHVQLNVDPNGIALSLLGGPVPDDAWPEALTVMRAALSFATAAGADRA